MEEFDKIILVWRKSTGSRREAIGELCKEGDKYIFRYVSNIKNLIENNKAIPYLEFQDIEKKYTENVLDIFAQRLTKKSRLDIKSLYDFWEIDELMTSDKFYLLGKTQGLVSTDNFEFLAQFKYKKGLTFLTEISALSINKLNPEIVKEGDRLSYVLETDNEFDSQAVKVFSNGVELGYIKKFHTSVFHSKEDVNIELVVKAIDKNGILKRVFVKVSCD